MLFCFLLYKTINSDFYSSPLCVSFTLGYRPKLKIRVVSPRGVSRDREHMVHCVHGKQIEYTVVYRSPLRVIDYDEHNKGVMKKDTIVYDKNLDRNFRRDYILRYSRPCLCGSLLHRNTKSLDCLLMMATL